MANPQTYASLSDAQRNAYNMVLLERAYPYTPMFKDGVKATISEHQGTTMEWRIYGSAVGTTLADAGAGLPLATTALTEGVAPAETQIAVTKISKAVQQFGAWSKLSDLLVHQGIDPIWTELYEMLGEQAGQTLHTLLINDIAGGTNIQYAGTTATTRATLAAGDKMTSAEIREGVRSLRRAKTPTFPDGFYHGLLHPDIEYDLMNDTDWKTISQYNGGTASGSNSLIKSSIGDYLGVRWMTSTDAPKFSSTVPVYGTLIYGPRWYGTVELGAYPTPTVNTQNQRGMRVTGVPVDTETKDDPLGQFGVAGWKTSYGGKILQQWRGVRIETAATA